MLNFVEIKRKLKIDDNYLTDNKETIIERLRAAYKLIIPKKQGCFSSSDIFGINQFIHLATSIVFLGANSESLKKLIDELTPKDEKSDNKKIIFKSDPTTIITIATLYYLLKECKNKTEFSATKILVPDTQSKTQDPPPKIEVKLGIIAQNIINRFEEVNWMIGDEDMKLLGVGRYDPNPNDLKKKPS